MVCVVLVTSDTIAITESCPIMFMPMRSTLQLMLTAGGRVVFIFS